ncbi:hypothetical protein HZU73_08642 [Apis mellifera caucasica]|nr:hypothetical protein HZU73_08642 [Apis mellifera caucasica]
MISDPNIPETGEQAARALHSNEENECCFHACSEELAGSGICANCTNQVLRRRGKSYDPPTAPYCEVNCTQPVSTGGGYQDTGSTDVKEEERCPSMNPVSVTNTMRLKGTLVCGTGGGVDTIASVSSSNRSAASILPQLFWLCSILTSILGNVRTIPVLWISKIFLWSIMPLAGIRSDDCDGSGGGDGGSGGGNGDRGLDGGSNKNRSELEKEKEKKEKEKEKREKDKGFEQSFRRGRSIFSD